MKKVISIVGTRPQLIKLAALTEKITRNNYRTEFCHRTIHTGQHYDYEMSRIFFQELKLPEPDYHLDTGSLPPLKQIARMMEKIEKILLEEKPDIVIVYGDTNTTIAGAISSAHLNIPIAHIESGLRSFRTDMPEEINRIVTDRISTLLFCPTKTAVKNLEKEGRKKNVFLVGDVMYDIFLHSQKFLGNRPILNSLGVSKKDYFLITVHRKENKEQIESIVNILSALNKTNKKFIFPLHPGTKKCLEENGYELKKFTNIKFIKPVGYLDMLYLEKNAKMIITDSGGVQKEAYWHRVPCLLLRKETEWKELYLHKYHLLVGNDIKKLLYALDNPPEISNYRPDIFGKGNASTLILNKIIKWMES